MNKPLSITLIALAGLVAAGAVWQSTRRGESPASKTGVDAPFLPKLASDGASASEIVVAHASGTFTVRLDGERWRVVEKANYPARVDTVRSVLVGLSQLRGAEAKTAKAENLAKLGLDDPTATRAWAANGATPPQSTLVTVKGSGGAELASAIVGNTKWGTPPGTYVRRPGEAQAYLAEGRVDVPREAAQWLEATIAGVDKARVRSVKVERPGQATLTASRPKPDGAFTLAGLPEGREVKDPGYADQLAQLLSSTTLQDVRAIAEVDFTPSEGPEPRTITTAEVRTFDGLVVRIESVPKDGRGWWRLSASVDETVEGLRPTDAPSDGPPTPALESVRKEAADLNAKWAGFAYAPVDFKARLLNVASSDLLKDVAAPAGPG